MTEPNSDAIAQVLATVKETLTESLGSAHTVDETTLQGRWMPVPNRHGEWELRGTVTTPDGVDEVSGEWVMQFHYAYGRGRVLLKQRRARKSREFNVTAASIKAVGMPVACRAAVSWVWRTVTDQYRNPEVDYDLLG